MNVPTLDAAQRRQIMEGMAAKFAEMRRRQAKAEMSQRGYRDENGQWQGGLLAFIRYFWPVLEPGNPFVDGWPLWAICLPYQSRIITEDGVKPIGDIVEGRWRGNVMSLNHATGESEWRPVAAHMKSPGQALLTIKVGDSTLELTANHPVFTRERGYVRADEIEKGDTVFLCPLQERICGPVGEPLLRPEAGFATVDSVERAEWIPDAVYNIEVEGNNNYFAEGILVHNCEHLEAVTFGEIQNLLINVPPGFMKACDVTTPVLTTDGWKLHGGLSVGDFVYGADGKPKKVLGRTLNKIEECYEVSFDDGSSAIVGAGHLWEVERDLPNQKKGWGRHTMVVETPDLRAGDPAATRRCADRIRLAAPLESPKRFSFGIDPYLLGAWLGDGSSRAGILYCGDQDLQHFKQFGKEVAPTNTTHRISVDGLTSQLRKLGLIQNKHIPEEYLLAPPGERWALLQGLMDTDGQISPQGWCRFTGKEVIARQFTQLASSLGLKPRLSKPFYDKSVTAKKLGPYYRVRFTAGRGSPIFRLARKQARVPDREIRGVGWRYIVGLRKVAPREVNCIQVEDSLYLITDRFIVTHNSLVVDVLWPAWEWGPMEMPHIRYVAFSYSSSLTQRDNGKFRDLMLSPDYQAMFCRPEPGDPKSPRFSLRKTGEERVSNSKHGYKLATSIGGVGTGERGDRIICMPAGQMIATERGLREISGFVEERCSSRVWSYNRTSGEMELKPVTGWHTNPGRPLVRVTTMDGRSIKCTHDHPILTADGYRKAADLLPGEILFAAPRWVGIASESVVVPQFQVEMRPNPTRSYSADGAHANLIFSGKRLPGLVMPQCDLAHQILSKVGGSILEGAVSLAVRNILRAGSIFNITESWVRSVVVLMADFLALRTWPNERLRYQLVDEAVDGLPFYSQGNTRVSFVEDRRHQSSWDSHSEGRSGHGAWDASNSSKVRDLVKPFAANNITPLLVGVSSVEFLHETPRATYCLTVSDNHNMVCGGENSNIIISNCDDPHNVKESESETVRAETIRWFRESMTSRLNNMQTGNKIVIMQRVHEGDISGTILDLDMDYTHLIIPMQYVWQADENNEPYATSIGWVDPRWTPDPEDSEGELAWPERWPAQTCVKLKKDLGEHAYAGQYQQTPEPRGGGIFKRHYWQPWEPPDGKFPAFSYVVASLDSAYTEDQENDPSALTVWGVFHPQPNYNRVMLVHAWQRWLEIQGPKLMQEPNEGVMAFRNRSQKEWGLIEWVHHTCNLYKVDRLLIEGKASGISVAQMLRKVYQRQRWSIIITPVKGDKVARAYSVQPSFSQEMVYYPHSQPLRKWVDMTINQMALFPKAKHDDLTDSACQGIKHLRDIGLLTEDDEVMAQMQEDVTQDGSRRNKPLTSLYPC